ncbi:TonB-dependent receptor [Sphingomonas sp. CL5.1]|uniref:TonB-dependent receptor plug domain-containing protein n=1 Tax=Sphingomonas sp. CL5.1 TaxID=2653203 RepID=UPI001583FC61|nr:TonB-dependent receptor [Sphingomonas sp. CL5.1]QKS01288.1 TonB-dependent receptor [Sphingomonas sp. CL5.1]
MRCTSFPAIAAAIVAIPAAHAQEAKAGGQDGNFNLGEIVVTAPRVDGAAIGSATLSSEAIYTFDRNTLDDAANLIPGVNAANTGGSRNERLIYVRGFNRFEVPLSIDGIRVYLPADNRIDFGRFLTPDIAEIQVAKGYVSVLDGPDGMGGAINLVTRKPVRPLEAEVRGTLGLGREGEYQGYNLSGLLGTRHDKWYAQASYARNFQDHWDLAGGFVPTATEDGGHRDLSRTSDWRVNARIGFTPNDSDEYAISYTRQQGSKLAPISTVDPLTSSRFWTWPEWNTDSLYFLSTTALPAGATLKTRVFYNTFYNMLRSFDTRDENSQTLPRAFNSPYWDKGYGASAELGVKPFEGDALAFSAHWRRDQHVEAQQSFPGGVTEPKQEDLEDTFSVAAENKLTLRPGLILTAGFGYDWRNLIKAEEYGAPLGTNPKTTPSRIYDYPMANSSIWNAQGRLDWTSADGGSGLYALISSRGRFPTIFERFSQRFGTSIPNPGLKPERATNYEIGAHRLFGAVRAEAAAFYSDVTDAIVSYPTIGYSCTASTTPGPCAPAALTQSRNLGHGTYYGGELSLEARLGSVLSLGGNYTYTHRDLHDPSNLAFRPTDVPTHKAFVYAEWMPLTRFHVIPSIDIASDRWTVTDIAPIVYYRTGSYANAALRLNYQPSDGLELGLGVRNLFDRNYQLVDGYPEAGRSYFLSARMRY